MRSTLARAGEAHGERRGMVPASMIPVSMVSASMASPRCVRRCVGGHVQMMEGPCGGMEALVTPPQFREKPLEQHSAGSISASGRAVGLSKSCRSVQGVCSRSSTRPSPSAMPAASKHDAALASERPSA